MKHSKYDQFKQGIAKQWRATAGLELPYYNDEYFDVVMSYPDQEDFKGGTKTKWNKDSEEFETIEDNKSQYKVIVSGHIVEIYEYEHPVSIGKKNKKTPFVDNETGERVKWNADSKQFESVIDPITGLSKGYNPISEKEKNARRSRLMLRRIISANFNTKAKFVTLTFKDGSVSDVTDIRECNKAFDKFMKRMRKRYGNFKYVKVIEFQDTNDRGAVHYHLMADLPYIKHEKIADIWGNGFIGVNRIDKVDNLGAYMTKYMMKNFDDPRLRGEKAYSASKGLIRPHVAYQNDAAELMAAYQLDKRKIVFENQYESEYQGLVKYKEFNLQREDKL